MKVVDSLWSGVVCILAILKSPFSDDSNQSILGQPIDHPRNFGVNLKAAEPPIFFPPGGAEDDVNKFKCNYERMPEYTDCSHKNRSCWLETKNKLLRNYDINTDYEKYIPKGQVVNYTLYLSDVTIAPDGVDNIGGQVFNGSYPGPWIQACWGDTLNITVVNNLKSNGTTIHWHGLRMLDEFEMDGVNGITQCPIAPGESMTYTFRARQYGTTWYHSHYSLQYGVGLAGPLTIHGPSSAHFDEPRDPYLMTDWSYKSAFTEWARSLELDPKGGWKQYDRPRMKSILLNGQGQYVPTMDEYESGLVVKEVPRYTTTYEKGKRYLLRLINTAVDATFVFSIDHHEFTVIAADFVPIEPYKTDHIVVGIGQRYHVIVHANPLKDAPGDNYWMRTSVAANCSAFAPTRSLPDERTGIVRYNASSPYDPLTKKEKEFERKCRDEPYNMLKPILKWNVERSSQKYFQEFRIGLSKKPGKPYWPNRDNITRWDMTDHPMWLDMGNPTINYLNRSQEDWDKLPHLAVIDTKAKQDAWIEMVLRMDKPSETKPNPLAPHPKEYFPVAHPIHLHGHDFALLAQSYEKYDATKAIALVDENLKKTNNNPPRRDVVLLPNGGYVVISFKADNPGIWIIHCHIAFHASSGLAMQIIENKDLIKVDDKARKVTDYQCAKWKKWFDEHDHPDHPVQDDSGI